MTAKGRKERLKSGDEHDAVSRKARRIVPFTRKRLRDTKRRMNRGARGEPAVEFNAATVRLRGDPFSKRDLAKLAAVKKNLASHVLALKWQSG